MLIMLEVIKIPTTLQISFIKIKMRKFLVFKQKNLSQYIQLPKFIFLKKKDGNFIFSCFNVEFNIYFKNFIKLFNTWSKRFEKSIVKKLILKGLGLKAQLDSTQPILELKLGFSHEIKIRFSRQDFNISVHKNIISVEGFNLEKINNFIYKIRLLKFPNAYKGKGIWYKNEMRIDKVIKKI